MTITLIGGPAYAGPVRNAESVYTQPDGTQFTAKVKGDEWARIRTTADGCAITRDMDGWWCYGRYNEEGLLVSTGYRVGKEVPNDILAQSRRIPYGRIAENSSVRRAATDRMRMSALKALRNTDKVATKTGEVNRTRRGIAILAQFQDVRFTYTKEDFLKMLNEPGYKGTGSAKDYYEQQFGDGWEFMFDVSEIVTLPNNRKYYGANSPDENGTDIRPATMAWHACKEADKDVDFSLYDLDGDGEVENVYIFYAGHDESEYTDQPDLMWAHQYYIFSGSESVPGYSRLDGVRIDRYACSSEMSGRKDMSGIGTFCHEFGHTFGLPDFYDTNYDNDDAWAPGLWRKTSLMDGGNYNNNSATPPNLNCIERKLLGLSEPVEIASGNSYSLAPIHKDGQSYMISSGTPGEYFLLEYRSDEGWDKYIGGKGMLVYRINENGEGYYEGEGIVDCWLYNIVNADPLNQCADLLEADQRSNIITDFSDFNDIRGIFYPLKNVTSITPELNPAYRFPNGRNPEFSIIGISCTDDEISFRTVNSDDIPTVSGVEQVSYTNYPDAILVDFSSGSIVVADHAFVKWNLKGSTDINTVKIPLSQDGTCSYLIEGLESGNEIYEIEIGFELNGISGDVRKIQVMTKRRPAVLWPYLYLNDGSAVVRDTGIVAHVVNSYGAAGISWFLDGSPLEISDDYRIYPEKSGTLSCEITWKDGSTDTIVKEITIIE